MTYWIANAREAAKTFRKLHPQVAARRKVAITSLADDPRPPGSLQLSGGDGEMRIRVAEYCGIYDVIDDELLVLV